MVIESGRRYVSRCVFKRKKFFFTKESEGRRRVHILLRHSVQRRALGQHLVSLSNNHTQREHVKKIQQLDPEIKKCILFNDVWRAIRSERVWERENGEI